MEVVLLFSVHVSCVGILRLSVLALALVTCGMAWKLFR